MKKLLVGTLVAAMVAVFVVGCGSSGGGAASSEAAPASSEAEAPAESEAPAPAESEAPAPAESEAPAEPEAPAEVKPIKIGLITMDLSNEFFGNVARGQEALITQTNKMLDITLSDGQSSPDKQAQDFDNFINSGQDIILSSTLDPASIADAAERALGMGIPVGTYPVIDGMTTCLTWDEYNWGRDLGVDAGNWIKDKLGGSAKIACFYQAETPSALDRYYGYMDGVNELNGEENITWLEPVNAITPEPAATAMESLIQANPDIKVVLATADQASISAYEALKTMNKLSDDMYIGGCDGDAQAMEYIMEGTPYRASSASARNVADLWGGLTQNIVRAYLGMDYVYNFPAPTKLVNTAEGATEYMESADKFVLDTDIANYFGITEVPIGKIADNHYLSDGTYVGDLANLCLEE